MYQVTVRTSAKDPKNPGVKYNRKTWKGLYLPEKKKSKVLSDKIKKEVEAKLRPELEQSNPGIEFCFFIEVERISTDFCFHEGE